MTGNCFGFGSYVEGPAVLHVTAGSPGTWRVYVDNYQNSFNLGQLSYDSTDNWSTWSAIQTFILTPTQAKQGTVIPYP